MSRQFPSCVYGPQTRDRLRKSNTHAEAAMIDAMLQPSRYSTKLWPAPPLTRYASYNAKLHVTSVMRLDTAKHLSRQWFGPKSLTNISTTISVHFASGGVIRINHRPTNRRLSR